MIMKFAKILNIIINGGILIVKEEFLMLLKSINREGMDELINLLKDQIFLKLQLVLDFMVVMKGDF